MVQTVKGTFKAKHGPEATIPTLDEAIFGLTTDTKKVFIGSDSGNVQLAKQEDLDTANSNIASKANQSDLDTTNTNIGRKADKTYVDSQNALKADKTYVDQQTGDLTTLQTTNKTSLVAAVNSNTTSLAQKAQQTDMTLILNSNSINPDTYTGTDLQKVQSAVNDAITNSRAIYLGRLFDLTGGTVKLGQTQRITLQFFGFNKGGFKKTDAGFMFDTDLTMVSDFTFNNVFFQGTAGAGTKIFNADKLYIVNTRNCIYNNVDTLVYTSDTGYVQSYRFIGDKAIGGNGVFFDIVGAYDTSIESCYYENRQDVFIHRALGNGVTNQNNLLFNVRIVDSIFQSVRNAIQAIGTRIFKVDGCYFEGNTTDIVLLKDTNSLNYNVTISNCSDMGTTGSAMVKWATSNNNAISINNHSSNIPLHDVSAITAGYILGINDKGTVTGTKYYNIVQTQYLTNGLQFGPFKKYKLSSGSISVPANTTQTVTLTCPESIGLDDIISVQIVPNSDNIADNYRVNYFFRDFNTSTNLLVNYSNNNASAGTVSIVAAIMKLLPAI